MRFARALLAVVASAVALGALVGSASASRLSLSSTTWRVTFAALTFEIREGFNAATCAVTLEGSFHSRSIVKRAGALIGYVNRAATGPCGFRTAATLLTETLPWHVRYESFAGTLPDITSVGIGIVGLGMKIKGINETICLTITTEREPLRLRLARETISRALVEAEAEGETHTWENCLFAPGRFIGRSGSVSVQGGTTRISVTLI
jgi:hypothetical protein